jgi:hypothetical protein
MYWNKDKYAVTLGGGQMNNPGRYLILLPPINGADAISSSPYFTANPGDKAHMWDATATFHWMPKQALVTYGRALNSFGIDARLCKALFHLTRMCKSG